MSIPSDVVDRLMALELRVADLESNRPPARALRPASSRAVVSRIASWLEIETALGLTWFNRLGAVALVAALAFAAAWANDQGYMSPAVRTLIAASVSLALLLFAGLKLRGAQGARRAFFTGIALIGAGGAFVVPATAALVDSLISPAAALAILVAVTVATLALAATLSVYALALVATVAGALVPLVSQSGDQMSSLVFIYLALLAVACVTVQVRRNWRGLDMILTAALAVYSVAWTLVAPSVTSAVCAGGVWAAALVYELWQRRVRRDLVGETLRVYALLLVAVAGGFGLLSGGGAWAALVLISAHVFVWSDRDRPRRMYTLLAMTAASCAVFSSALAAAMLLPFLWQAIRRDESGLAVLASGAVGLAWITLGIDAGQPGLAAVAVAAYAATCVFIGADERKRSQALANALITAGGACAVVAAWPTALALAPDKVSFAVTVAATGVGLALVIMGMVMQSRFIRATGLAFVGGVAAKLVAVDVWSLSSGARIVALSALGVGFLGISFLYTRVVSSGDGHKASR